jgi:hypothetical protein
MERKTFTKKEDNVILKNIAMYPNNLAASFDKSSEDLGRSPGSCAGRYYSTLRNESTVIAVASKGGMLTLNNQKNSRRVSDTKLSQEDRLELVKEMIQTMNRSMKKEIVKILFY